MKARLGNRLNSPGSLLGSFFAGVGVCISLLTPVIRLGFVGVCRAMGRHVGAIFGRMTFNGMTSTFGNCTHGQGASSYENDGCFHGSVAVLRPSLAVMMAAVGVSAARVRHG